jgi:hypothetical protein
VRVLKIGIEWPLQKNLVASSDTFFRDRGECSVRLLPGGVGFAEQSLSAAAADFDSSMTTPSVALIFLVSLFY